MTVLSEIQALAVSVAGRLNAIAGRILPTGGTAGQIVTKTASGYDWKTPLADFPVLVVNRAEIATANGFQSIGRAFTTVQINNIVVDSHSGWNPESFTYTVQQDGVYEVRGTLRFADVVPSNTSVGIGVDIVNADTAGFIWQQSPITPTDASNANIPFNGTTSRQALINIRTMNLTAGQQVRLFGYWDGSTTQNVWAGELAVFRIR